MEVSDRLYSLFSARVEERDGSYVVEIPKREVEVGAVAPDEVYRVGLLPAATGETRDDADREPSRSESRSSQTGGSRASSRSGPRSQSRSPRQSNEPPVEEGAVRDVEIEDLGEQGDGLARIGPGYVVFVPGTDVGDRVSVEITDARDNFAFAEVVQ
jgi:predicted RNA-binding protein with TRAM domain